MDSIYLWSIFPGIKGRDCQKSDDEQKLELKKKRWVGGDKIIYSSFCVLMHMAMLQDNPCLSLLIHSSAFYPCFMSLTFKDGINLALLPFSLLLVQCEASAEYQKVKEMRSHGIYFPCSLPARTCIVICFLFVCFLNLVRVLLVGCL